MVADHAEMTVESARGDRIVLLSPESVALASQFRWSCSQASGGRHLYASTRIIGTQRTVHLHRMICAPPDGMVVDHINGDTLDNRMENLRVTTVRGNLRNRGAPRQNTSGVKGVGWHAGAGKWRARAKDDLGREVHLGLFDDLAQAARAAREFRAKNYPTSPEARGET